MTAGGGGGTCTACAGTAVGSGVPQKPQNLLPNGNDLWHFGQATCGTTGPAGGRGATVVGASPMGPVGTGGWPPNGAACSGFPHRLHAAAVAGFIFPHEGQRMYRIVPCSLVSGLMSYPVSESLTTLSS